MNNTQDYDATRQFQSIAHASRTTGISKHMLRKLCKEGKAPYVTLRSAYMINVPGLLELLTQQSMQAVTA